MKEDFLNVQFWDFWKLQPKTMTNERYSFLLPFFVCLHEIFERISTTGKGKHATQTFEQYIRATTLESWVQMSGIKKDRMLVFLAYGIRNQKFLKKNTSLLFYFKDIFYRFLRKRVIQFLLKYSDSTDIKKCIIY